MSTEFGQQCHPWQSLRPPRHQLDQRRALLLQEQHRHPGRATGIPSCTATSPAAPSADRSSRTSFFTSSATSTCMFPIRRQAIPSLPFLLDSAIPTERPTAWRQIVEHQLAWTTPTHANGFTVGASDWAEQPRGPGALSGQASQRAMAHSRTTTATSPIRFRPPTPSSRAPRTSLPTRPSATSTGTPRPKDLVSLKYYYQHDPNSSPYGTSSVPGFTEHMDTGSQVATHHQHPDAPAQLQSDRDPRLLREKAYSTNEQPGRPARRNTACGHDHRFRLLFSRHHYRRCSWRSYGSSLELPQQMLNIGPSAANQGAFTGVFQNRFSRRPMPSGRRAIIPSPLVEAMPTRSSMSVTCARAKGNVSTPDFSTFAMNWVSPYSTDGFVATTFLQGDANRYYRANQTGLYFQDKYQVRPNLSITAGVRYDWNGGLTEKYGRIYNFDPSAVQLRCRVRYDHRSRLHHCRQ